MNLTRRTALQRIGLAAGTAALGAPALAATTTIRIGVAQPATGTPPSFGGSAISIAHAKGWLEDEFKTDGVKDECLFFKGAGIEQAYRFRLSRTRFDADPWIDRRYLNSALREQRLETYRPMFQANGNTLGA